MKLKTLFATTLVAFGLVGTIGGQAQAAPVWTFTMHGVITDGIDNAGLFGNAGQDLTGLRYTQTITASVDPSHYKGYGMETNDPGHDFTGYSSNLWGNVSGASFTDTVTINGTTLSFTASSLVFAFQTLANGFGPADPSAPSDPYIRIDSDNTGHNSVDGYILNAINSLTTNAPADVAVPTPDFGQTLSGTIGDGDGHTRTGHSMFALNDTSYNLLAYFSGRPESLAVNAPAAGPVTVGGVAADGGAAPADVPEPASIALLGLGLAGLGAVRRKTRA